MNFKDYIAKTYPECVGCLTSLSCFTKDDRDTCPCSKCIVKPVCLQICNERYEQFIKIFHKDETK